MARPRNADAELTRQRILDSAIGRFGSQGLSGTSLRVIAGDVGVTFATVHHHFGSKSELFSRCMDASYQQLSGLREVLAQTLARTEGSIETKVAAVARSAFVYAREHATVSRFLLRANVYETAANDRTQQSQQQYLDQVSEILSPVLDRPARELRIPLQGLMFLLTRLAVMSETELSVVAAGTNAELMDEQLADYVATVAVSTLVAR
jgi:AcrR family transcriptional regulator